MRDGNQNPLQLLTVSRTRDFWIWLAETNRQKRATTARVFEVFAAGFIRDFTYALMQCGVL
jgi:hypothetical protein